MSYKSLWTKALVLFVVALVIVGCTTEVDFNLGAEYVPTNQNMELRRRVYRAGVMEEMGEQKSITMSKTYLHQSDSIKSSNLDDVYFGQEQSAEFGTRRAGFMSQVLFGSKLDEEYGWGYRPIFDSMTLALYVTSYHGDTTRCRKFGVYEITSNSYIADSKDSVFYAEFDPKPYVSSKPIFTFTYPNQDKGVYVGDMENPHYESVTLEETNATMEYIRRLMFTTELDDEGYARDTAEIYEQGNEEKFVERIRGVYIAPLDELASDDQGAMFSTDVENSALVLYARSRYKEDPAIIKDTVIMSYNFYINPTEYNVKAGNISISHIEHEFNADDMAAVQEHREVLVGKVDAMTGIVTEVEFTDEFLQSLADIAKGRKGVKVSVNQAHLNIYLEGSGYDYNFADPIALGEIMDGSMVRMGLYSRYGGYEEGYTNDIIAISDYLYTKESSSFVIAYDGYLNRSLGCYTMDISNFMQQLISNVISESDENGVVDVEKFKTDKMLQISRRMFVGPSADALYGFNHQRIIGGDAVEVDGVKNSAPMTLELVYTVVY
ncbi:MAG: DUF4270 family protein [Alistipes sp.]|nr:DUF4270 family protein [Alistipes sp.]